MSRAEIFIWMAAISLFTFVSTIFLTDIIVDDLAIPTTSLDGIKEIISIFTSIFSISLTIIGLYIAKNGLCTAREGLSTWRMQLKTNRSLTVIEETINFSK